MFKPTILPYWANNPYKEQIKQVGIYKDTLEIDNSEVKVLIQREPPDILDIRNEIIKNASKYDLILTWNEEIVNNCKNAKFFAFGDRWINTGVADIPKLNYISFLTSDKNYAVGHKLRQEIFEKIKNIKKINDFKIVSFRTPPRIPSKEMIFDSFKFSIIVENCSTRNFFTEKLIDCFSSKTIPIYWGCPNIGDFFNKDGMILFDNLDDLFYILQNLTPKDYEKRLEAIEENFIKSHQYADFFSRVDNEVTNFLSEKCLK